MTMFSHRKNFIAVRRTKPNEQGFVLITVVLFMALFAILGLMLMYKVTLTTKASGLTKMGMVRFQGAEGGALAVASWMAKYKRTDVPVEVIKTGNYSATVVPLGNTIRYPVGYSTMWKGADIRINSVSPPAPNDKSEVEMVVFIPLSPVGYGNE